ncbi:Multidrug resistance protein MdtC [Hyalomma marginatum]|uniref:Multidrug resistance protein MdtC n=1 Tax=Hyalomma marginatum TaxID=34627 RepID=A0A8S4C3V0_9ACAR|nr:Multidrug resistance protein MdtC [Hyalomma marginatum]CAG7592904.1 Multidrug resistance protein MdtC [Hyalomma marginatum]
MTTGTMIFGAIPLMLSSDAGYEARHDIGVVLIGGLTLGIFFLYYPLSACYTVKRFVERKRKPL